MPLRSTRQSSVLNDEGQIVGTIIVRNGTAAALASVVPEAGEWVYATDTGKATIGDGLTSFATLRAVGGSDQVVDSIQFGDGGVRFLLELSSSDPGVNVLRVVLDGQPYVEFQEEFGIVTFGVPLTLAAGFEVTGGAALSTLYTLNNKSTTPSAPGLQHANVYVRNNKLIVQMNDSGTTRYKYLDLTGTSVTWVHTTSAP